MSKYWVDRNEKTQRQLMEKTDREIERQLKNYYKQSMLSVMDDFEATYNKLIATVGRGKEPTPADLYKLDKYWQLQGQLTKKLTSLGDKQAALMSKKFVEQWTQTYRLLAIKTDLYFGEVDLGVAKQMVNQIWCADGKSWSQRIWNNIGRLQETLNEGLIDCVATGKSTTELRQRLQERFAVSYSRADTIIRTETAHIQTQSAAQRYIDAGIEKYLILGNENDSCGSHKINCSKMDRQEFYFSEMVIGVNAPPFHPNCKCTIKPIV